MTEQANYLASIKRGFLLWSWIGLLGAFISTSAIFATQILMIAREGIRIFEFRSSQVYSILTLLFPAIVIMMAWLTFYRYSIAIYQYAVLELKEIDNKYLYFLFRSSVLYLILSWLIGFVCFLLPFLLNIGERF